MRCGTRELRFPPVPQEFMTPAQKTRIHVFVTSTKKFRALISEPGKPPYEVTVGGGNWKLGLAREYRERIQEKIKRILAELELEARKVRL